jgi:hypothetical protein
MQAPCSDTIPLALLSASVNLVQNTTLSDTMRSAILLLLLTASATASAVAQERLIPEDHHDYLPRQYQNVRLANLRKVTFDYTDTYLVRFSYSTPGTNRNWPAGSGFFLMNPDTDKPVWSYLKNGDFGPHSVSLIDINSDGEEDLYFYAGTEDVYNTYLYVASRPASTYSVDNFVQAYHNANDYSVLVRLGEKKKLTILDSGHSGSVNKSSMHCLDDPTASIVVNPDYRAVIPDTTREEISAMYNQITQELDHYNFSYGSPNLQPLFNTFLFSPIKVFEIHGQYPTDVTARHPAYLQWRIDVLESIRSASSAACARRINPIIEYLKVYLERWCVSEVLCSAGAACDLYLTRQARSEDP